MPGLAVLKGLEDAAGERTQHEDGNDAAGEQGNRQLVTEASDGTGTGARAHSRCNSGNG